MDPLAETMAPEIRNSTDFALEEESPAGPAPSATTETVAAAGSGPSIVTPLPAALPLGDKGASHSPTSAPPAPGEKGLAPQMGFIMDSSPTATGVTASRALALGTEATRPSQQSSVTKAAVPNTPMGTAGREQLSSAWLFPNPTASAATRAPRAAAVPQASSGGGPGTAVLATGNAGIATLRADAEGRRENSSCSEGHAGVLGSPALAGSSPAPSPDHSEYTSHGICTCGNSPAGVAKPHSELGKRHLKTGFSMSK